MKQASDRLLVSADAPNVNSIVASSPTVIRNFVSGQDLQNVITAYDQSLKSVFITCVPIAGFAAICALFIKNRPLLGGQRAAPKGEGAASEDMEKQAVSTPELQEEEEKKSIEAETPRI